MSNRHSFFAAALFSGFLFWSWGGVAGWRTMQLLGYPGYRAAVKAPAKRTTAFARAKAQDKVELSRRLEAAVKEPAKISPDDLADVQAAFGKDAAGMLKLLKDSAR